MRHWKKSYCANASFLQIIYAENESALQDQDQMLLEMSSDHLVYVADHHNPIPASKLQLGDHLQLANGRTAPVV